MGEYYWENHNGFDGYCLAISDGEAIERILNSKVISGVERILKKTGENSFESVWHNPVKV